VTDKMGLEDLFSFGKHTGQQLEDVIHDDPDYVAWLIMEDAVGFDEETLELISRRGIA